MKARHLILPLLFVAACGGNDKKVDAAYKAPPPAPAPKNDTAKPAAPKDPLERPPPDQTRPADDTIRPQPPVPAESAGESAADHAVSVKVRGALLDDPAVWKELSNLKVVTNSGVVTLTGIAATDASKQRVDVVVMAVPGVVKLEDKLEVKQVAGAPPVVPPKDDAEDRGITDRIRLAILDDSSVATEEPHITIATKAGIVTLTGTVGSDAQKTRVEQLANAVGSIKRVDNKIEVKVDPSKTPPVGDVDKTITEKVQLAIANDPTVATEAANVAVTTASGAVMLKGSVQSQTAKEQIEALAKGVPGVVRVDNQLEVKGP